MIVLFGGCFATCGYFDFGGCFAAVPLLWRMLCCHGRAIRSMLRHHLVLRACSPLASLATIFCAGPALRVAFVWVACLECPLPPCFFCCPPVVLVATAVSCVRLYSFFSVSLSLVLLCSCVSQVLFGRNKFVSVTAFFLMKNVLSHGCGNVCSKIYPFCFLITYTNLVV